MLLFEDKKEPCLTQQAFPLRHLSLNAEEGISGKLPEVFLEPGCLSAEKHLIELSDVGRDLLNMDSQPDLSQSIAIGFD